MDKNDSVINLTESEFRELVSREKSHGSDGMVIPYDRKHLIKLYHSKVDRVLKKEAEYTSDDSDMKFYEKGVTKFDINKFEDIFLFYQNDSGDSLRLRNEDAIYKAIEKQQRVKNTRLPKSVVLVNGKFVGCLIQASYGLQIHKLIGFPLKFKKAIMLKVLHNVKELLDNYIYHVDLDNSPYASDSWFKGELVGHSHVLINPFTLKPQIIDLDGKSTIYRDGYSEKDEKESLYKFSRLMTEFLLGIDLNEYNDDDSLRFVLEDIGVRLEYIDKIIDHSMSYDELETFINEVDNIKRL